MFNSPVLFNLGLHAVYGTEGSARNYAWSESAGRPQRLKNRYERPLCSACFIVSVEDSMEGIFRAIMHEALIYQDGGGSGTSVNMLRSENEKLSGGGTSSGPLSFLRVFDAATGATKSGGTTRRAASGRRLDVDHPDIMSFIGWKKRQEEIARVLLEAGIGLDANGRPDYDGEAYRTVSGQNGNNMIGVTDAFMQAVERGEMWSTTYRTTKEIAWTRPARDIWKFAVEAAWFCADPTLQFYDTFNRWHTVPAEGPIIATNPCAEFCSIPDTACNLASLNLTRFLRPRADGTLQIDARALEQAVRVFIIAQETIVDYAGYPTADICKNSHVLRPLGLGIANLGALLMRLGLPYDSEEGRNLAASIMGFITAAAYKTSAEIAVARGAFEAWTRNREPMLAVLEKHQAAYTALAEKPGTDPAFLRAGAKLWATALSMGRKGGYRNSSVSLIAPTGTIAFVMDCDTTGCEPDFALVKYKKLAGGGHVRMVNESVRPALAELGYKRETIDGIMRYLLGTGSLGSSERLGVAILRGKGFDDDAISRVEQELKTASSLDGAFSPATVGEATLARMGISPEEARRSDFKMLKRMGLSDAEIESETDRLLGAGTIEGAPGFNARHLPVFDCAVSCGRHGTRVIEPMGHIAMVAALQPHLSMSISKTINVPFSTTPDEIGELWMQAWKLGIKGISVYRDGCKLSQPLTTGAGDVRFGRQAGEAQLLEEMRVLTEPESLGKVPGGYAGHLRALSRKVRSWLHLDTHPDEAFLAQPPERHRLPRMRVGMTYEVRVGGHKIFVRTGEYKDGTLGEVFIDIHKEGASFRSLLGQFAIAISLMLQYGVPLDELVGKFSEVRFEPCGAVTGDENGIRFTTSIIDYVMRLLGVRYLGRKDLANDPEHIAPDPRLDLAIVKQVDALIADGALHHREGARVLAEASTGYEGAGERKGGTEGLPVAGGAQADSAAPLLGRQDGALCSHCGNLLPAVFSGRCVTCQFCGSSNGCS
jgi:ribonucleoside-diphosphate reductase alpha chain